MIKSGDAVTIKPKWQDVGDDQIAWVAVDDEEKGRVTIEAQLGLPVNPTQVVNIEWLVLCVSCRKRPRVIDTECRVCHDWRTRQNDALGSVRNV